MRFTLKLGLTVLLPLVFGGVQCAGPIFNTDSSRIPLPRPFGEVSTLDTDGDDIQDSSDNCPRYPNADQADADSNGVGDVCEPREPSMPQLLVRTSMGNFVIELNDELAPVTVDNILQYVDDGFYTDTVVHRVDESQGVVQWGGFDLDFNQKPTRDPVISESDNGLKNVRGSIGLARLPNPDTGTSQMYCNFKDNPGFDTPPGFTVFGRVIAGMDIIDQISEVSVTSRNGQGNVPVVDIIVESIERN